MATTDRRESESRFVVDSLAGITLGHTGPHSPAYAAFLAGFDRDPAGDGAFVHTDPSGWPLAISPAWFEAPDRSAREPARAIAAAIGRTIADPAQIRLVWQAGVDGRQVLVRRYIADHDDYDVVVDVGCAGWTFASSRDPDFEVEDYRGGDLVWPAPAVE